MSYNANQFNTVGTFAAVFTLAALSFIVDRLMFLVTKRPADSYGQCNIQ